MPPRTLGKMERQSLRRLSGRQIHTLCTRDKPKLQNLERKIVMATYIVLLQFTDQGIRNIKDTTKRATAATEAAAKVGVKFTDLFWTLGQYDLAIVAEAQDEETMTALMLKLASLGNVKSQTLRAFRAKEMERILTKAG